MNVFCARAVALQAPVLVYILLLGVTIIANDMTIGLLGWLLILYLPVMALSTLGALFFYYTVWTCTTSIDDLEDRLNRMNVRLKELEE